MLAPCTGEYNSLQHCNIVTLLLGRFTRFSLRAGLGALLLLVVASDERMVKVGATTCFIVFVRRIFASAKCCTRA